jgi:hypothetical protein
MRSPIPFISRFDRLSHESDRLLGASILVVGGYAVADCAQLNTTRATVLAAGSKPPNFVGTAETLVP